MRTLLSGISHLHTCDDRRRVIDDAWVLVEADRVRALGGASESAPDADEVIDLAGCLVMPGFVNLHHHFFQSLTRALPGAQKSTVLGWLETLYPLWARMTPADSAIATRLACAELLLSGCTTCADHAYLVPGGDDEFLDAELDAARDMGLRLHLAVGGAPTLEGDLESRIGESARTRLVQSECDVLSQMQRFASRRHDAQPGSMTRIVLGPVGVSYEKPDLMSRVARIASESGCGLHTHLHPRPDEREKAARLLGSTPVAFLERAGWLRPGTWFAHGSQLLDEEMSVFADRGVGVAHCPHTIPRLGFPLTRIAELRRRGVPTGIGTDGPASNDCGSMLADIRLGLILHRIGTTPGTDTEEDWLSPADVLWMATREGARVLGRDDIGAIAPGMIADITAFRLDRVDCAGGLADPLGALLMASSWSRATLTLAAGKPVVRDGELAGANETVIASDANRATARLLGHPDRMSARLLPASSP